MHITTHQMQWNDVNHLISKDFIRHKQLNTNVNTAPFKICKDTSKTIQGMIHQIEILDYQINEENKAVARLYKEKVQV